VQVQRRRLEKGKATAPCALCGSGDVVLVESVAVRRGIQLLNPLFHRHARQYELCRSCGAKHADG